jgi:hypothetical protein
VVSYSTPTLMRSGVIEEFFFFFLTNFHSYKYDTQRSKNSGHKDSIKTMLETGGGVSFNHIESLT